MGIEAEIYDKKNNPILTDLKDDIICPICCAVLQVIQLLVVGLINISRSQ